MKNYKIFLGIGIIISTLIFLLSIFLVQNIYFNKTIPNDIEKKQVTTIKNNLVNQFKGAYKKDITKNGNIVEYDIVASKGKVEIIDGYTTDVWNYNGQVPGPALRVKLGDTVKINFTNNLPQATTIHWHGVRVPNNMDGVPGISQKPIQPGETFIYQFTPKDAGTFWYHPHVRSAEQMERGLYGTLVVEESENKYSQDKLWVIDDWRLTEDIQINESFVTGMDLMHDGRWGNSITVNTKQQELLQVRPGERIRLRLVNTSNARVYKLNIGDLPAKVIAVDGIAVRELFNPEGFELAPGNRIDLDITFSKKQKNKKYVIYDQFTRNKNILGVINVQGKEVETPIFLPKLNKKIPSWNEASNLPFDEIYRLNARRGGKNGIEWTINGKPFSDREIFTFKYNSFNKLRFVNQSSRLHPMHLHGQFFKVLARNGVPVDEPYFRDTILVKGKETIDLGLVPLDKGEWLLHCHILEHAEAGMMTSIIVK